MTPEPRSVKPPRSYDASRRREAAHCGRTRILEVAQALFLRDGYAATTVAAVAAAAGVSVETIYKTFRGKPGLIRTIQRKGLEGAAAVSAPDRSDQLSASDLAPRVILRHWAELTGEVMPRVAPINLLVRAAASADPDMGELLAEITDQRLQRMRHNASRLTERGELRPGVTVDVARDIMFAYTAPELYEILVIQQHWSIERYIDFIDRGLAVELLDNHQYA